MIINIACHHMSDNEGLLQSSKAMGSGGGWKERWSSAAGRVFPGRQTLRRRLVSQILRWDLRISSLWKTGWGVPASCSASCPGSSRVGWTFQTVLTCCGGAWIYIPTLTCHWGEAVPKSVSTPQSRYTVFSLVQHPEQSVSWPQTLGDNPTGRQAGQGWSSPQAPWSRAFFGRW